MTNPRNLLVAFASLVSMLLATTHYAFGQSEKEIQTKLDDLRSDDIPHNCESSTKWFLKNREKLKDRLVEEFREAKDPQARDAIFHVLFNTKSFVPDPRFVAAVIARLPQEDKFVGNGDIFAGPTEGPDRLCDNGAHWEAWKFINDHFDVFEPKLKEQISKTDSVLVLWGTAWLLKKHGLLQDNIALFTPAVLDEAAENLKTDKVWYNASQSGPALSAARRFQSPCLACCSKISR